MTSPHTHRTQSYRYGTKCATIPTTCLAALLGWLSDGGGGVFLSLTVRFISLRFMRTGELPCSCTKEAELAAESVPRIVCGCTAWIVTEVCQRRYPRHSANLAPEPLAARCNSLGGWRWLATRCCSWCTGRRSRSGLRRQVRGSPHYQHRKEIVPRQPGRGSYSERSQCLLVTQ